MKLTIYRDDYCYPIHASSFEEMRKKRAEENRGFISHWYGTVAVTYDHPKYPGVSAYFDIYTEKQVTINQRGW